MSWETPKTDWATDDGIGTADLNRIEESSVVLHKGNGQPSISTIAVESDNLLNINKTESVFIVGGNYAISFIKTEEREPGNRISLILEGKYINHLAGTPSVGYKAVFSVFSDFENSDGIVDKGGKFGVAGIPVIYDFIYTGSLWHIVSTHYNENVS
jgi:hypothetical protein